VDVHTTVTGKGVPASSREVPGLLAAYCQEEMARDEFRGPPHLLALFRQAVMVLRLGVDPFRGGEFGLELRRQNGIGAREFWLRELRRTSPMGVKSSQGVGYTGQARYGSKQSRSLRFSR
jgi:hypothetical protein